MTPQRTRGICIGGPQAGEWVEHFGTSFRSRPKPSTLVVGDEVTAAVTITTVIYTMRMMRTPEKEFVFWVPVEFSDTQAMDMLVLGYIHDQTRRARGRDSGQ